MKNIFLLMKYYLDPQTKPFPKFDYQISALRSMGYNVYFLGIDGNKILLCHEGKQEVIYKMNFSQIPIISTILTYDILYKATNKVFQKYNFDLAYIRYMPMSFSYSKALETIKGTNCKIVIEIPTYPIHKELETEKRIFRKWYFKKSNNFFIENSSKVDLFAVIGDNTTSFAKRPAINIENGIVLKNIPLRRPNKSFEEIHILALANMAWWHGYDRLIKGLKQYKDNGGKKKVVLHFVGPDGDGSLQKWRKLSKEYKLEENVIFDGPKYGEDLNWYFNNCHVAIGSIGMHRKTFSSTSELKVREYMARGLPFVLSVNDQSIDEYLGFYLKIPNNDTPVDIELIIKFVFNIEKKYNLHRKMREFASEKMTWEKQFEKIFLHLKSIENTNQI
ncbi:glycosyltransferase family 4 protein [Fictibacillus nanhaiensis]|uniref:Glycosyltransferase family 4 protein n=1 Tax=Fictibacillus nanhaiensis TaxID=742169 RepID=A0ABS2ZMA0_9BACL|nr:glycosyltransferase family 4 protein [Fictibacillus nanhaiensis]